MQRGGYELSGSDGGGGSGNEDFETTSELESPVPGTPTVRATLPSARRLTLNPRTPAEVEIPRLVKVNLNGPNFFDFLKRHPMTALLDVLRRLGLTTPGASRRAD